MARALVTGGAGFVGRHVVKHLLQRGDEVVCVDNIAPLTGGIDPADGWPGFEPRDWRAFSFFRMDCRQYFERFSGEAFDQAFHLAAIVGGREVIEKDPLAVAEDLAIDSLFWRWARSAKPKWTGCFSSSAAYPVRLQRKEGYRLLKEEDIDFSADLGLPDLTYGWAKLTCEYLAKLAYERHGLKCCIFRPFSGYGEDQDMAYPFPSIVRRAIEHRGSKKITVWGTGDQMRDFVHIDDCVELIMLASRGINDSGAINISTGVYTSFKELMREVAAQLGYIPEVVGLADKPEGVFARGGDTGRQAALGFVPKITLPDGIRRAIDYQLKHVA